MSAYSVVVVCEAQADREIACGLANRVLTRDINWAEPETMVRYCGLSDSENCLTWKSIPKLAREAGIPVRGYFDGRPGEADAKAVRRALLLVSRKLPTADAILLIRDLDADRSRLNGLEQGRKGSWKFADIVGVAIQKREAWVLAGFRARTDAERTTLEELRQELGFDPCKTPELLDSSEEGAKKDAKRVLRRLTGGDRDREPECWCQTPLDDLRAAGLESYLDELKTRLVPVLRGRSR